MFPIFVDHIPKPLDGRENLVKYVEFTGTQPGVCQYIQMETSLLLEHLKEKELNKNLQNVLDKMMLVKLKESKEKDILHIFERGICCNDPVKQYTFLGHSREQLKEKICLFIRESQEYISDILADFADFQQVKPIERRADQIGALFSPLGHNVNLGANEYDVIDAGKMPRGAVSLGRGCGLISHELCEAVKDLYNLPRAPNIVQVRYQAYQGVLLKHQYMSSKASFTKSMEMFAVPPSSVTSFSDSLAVLDYSKPYEMGYLDTLSVMMLEERGVDPDHLVKLQDCHNQILQKIAQENVQARTWFMYNIGKIDVATELQSGGAASSHEGKETVAEVHAEEVGKMKKGTFKDSNGEEMQDYRILVFKSREVLGVRDPYSQLKSDECFFNPTLPSEESEKFKLAEELLIMHRPCYNPDHIYSLKLVHKSNTRGAAYENIEDCLVFGGSSAFDMCNGGALGDRSKFFVSWDKELLPGPLSQAAPATTRLKNFLSARVVPTCMQWGYLPNLKSCSRAFSKCLDLCGSKPSLADEIRRKAEQRSELMSFFASFKDLLSQAEELFMKYASSEGPSSGRCRLLSNLLCGGIDPCTQMEEAKRIIKEVQHMDNEAGNQEESDTEKLDESSALLVNAALGQADSQKRVWRTMGERAANFPH